MKQLTLLCLLHPHRVGLLIAALLLLGLLTPAVAQSDPASNAATPTPVPDEFQRGLQRVAPLRQPQVLTQAADAGAINTILELPPEADTYVASGRPNQNFGGDSLFLGFNQAGDGFGAERPLLRFAVASQIPADAEVRSARLRLRLAFANPGSDEPMNAVVQQVTSHWNETSVTWNQQPSLTSTVSSGSVISTPSWVEWDVTDLVRGWVNGNVTNHGLALIGDERNQQRERAFYSRETATDFFPRLVVDYAVIIDNEAPLITVNPLPAFVRRNFTVGWSGSDRGATGIAYYDVEYRVDGGDWQGWLTQVTATTEEFPDGQNGRRYEFRARGVDNAGNVEPFGDPEAATTVDTRAPTTRVTAPTGILNTTSFTVAWTGGDGGGSGVRYYDVQYRLNGGTWQPWQQQTVATDAVFVAPGEGFYEFEVRAVDNLGLQEDFRNEAEIAVIVDIAPPFVAPVLWFTFIAERVVPSGAFAE